MTLCAKGCGRQSTVRGMCKSHYTTQLKRDLYLSRRSSMRSDAVGVERRLQALVSIGWNQAEISRRSGLDASWISKLMNNTRRRVNRATYRKIVTLYNELSMTPGPCSRARSRAARRGWAPPLAWDDDTIDNPAAAPDLGQSVTVSFADKITELRDCGYSDLIIAQRLGVQPASLLRQLNRYNITPDPELVYEATSRKWARSRERAS